MICDRTFTLFWYLSDGQNLNLPTCFRWGHGDAKVMPCLQEYGSSPVPLELSSSPELQYCCFPAMAVPKHFFPMSRITVASGKKLTNKKPMHTKPTNQTKNPQKQNQKTFNAKPKTLSISASVQDLLQVTAITCLFQDISVWSKEKEKRRAAAGEN